MRCVKFEVKGNTSSDVINQSGHSKHCNTFVKHRQTIAEHHSDPQMTVVICISENAHDGSPQNSSVGWKCCQKSTTGMTQLAILI